MVICKKYLRIISLWFGFISGWFVWALCTSMLLLLLNLVSVVWLIYLLCCLQLFCYRCCPQCTNEHTWFCVFTTYTSRSRRDDHLLIVQILILKVVILIFHQVLLIMELLDYRSTLIKLAGGCQLLLQLPLEPYQNSKLNPLCLLCVSF